MKTLNKHLVLIAAMCSMFGCESPAPSYDTAIVIQIDQSDPLTVHPNINEIVSLLDLTEHPYQGIHATISYVSDKDVNPVHVIILEPANALLSNPDIRRAKIDRFKKDLTAALHTDSAGQLDHSIIYRSAAKLLNSLAAAQANHKYFLLYSNLKENSQVNFYDPETRALLQREPEQIKRQFEQNVRLQNLSGVTVWILYDPLSYENNSEYMETARFYKNHLLQPRGAVVHIERSIIK